MSRKKSLMPRVKGEWVAPPRKMTPLEKLYPLNESERGSDTYRHNEKMREMGNKWYQYAMLFYGDKPPSSMDFSRPFVDSSASRSKLDGAMARRLDASACALKVRQRIGERTASVLDIVIYGEMTIESAASILLKRDNSGAVHEMRGRFRQALEAFASYERFSGT